MKEQLLFLLRKRHEMKLFCWEYLELFVLLMRLTLPFAWALQKGWAFIQGMA